MTCCARQPRMVCTLGRRWYSAITQLCVWARIGGLMSTCVVVFAANDFMPSLRIRQSKEKGCYVQVRRVPGHSLSCC